MYISRLVQDGPNSDNRLRFTNLELPREISNHEFVSRFADKAEAATVNIGGDIREITVYRDGLMMWAEYPMANPATVKLQNTINFAPASVTYIGPSLPARLIKWIFGGLIW